VLAHTSSVSTLYGHMSRFARQMHVGTHVQQGDVIGYVGMTGLATGPHLHYEYLVNGVHKNPQTVQLPGAEPLPAQDLLRFRSVAAPLLAVLIPGHAAAGPPAVTADPTAAGPLAAEPPASDVFAASSILVSSILNDSVARRLVIAHLDQLAP
jgi:hypothetical protein